MNTAYRLQNNKKKVGLRLTCLFKEVLLAIANDPCFNATLKVLLATDAICVL